MLAGLYLMLFLVTYSSSFSNRTVLRRFNIENKIVHYSEAKCILRYVYPGSAYTGTSRDLIAS